MLTWYSGKSSQQEEISGIWNIRRDETDLASPESDVSMIADYTGENSGLGPPKGGILNLTVLRKLTSMQRLWNHNVSRFFLPIASEISEDQRWEC